MFDNLSLYRGDLNDIVKSESLSPLMKVFSSVSACDGNDILRLLDTQLSIASSETDKVKLKILAAVIYLVNIGNRNLCVRILNDLGAPSNERCAGWQSDLFISLWNMLIIYLREKQSVNSLPLVSEDIVVIGDSHTIGLAVASRDKWRSGCYIPGFRLSLLASPQQNLKIVALKNALCLNYDKSSIFLSLGEIDFRSAAINADENMLSFKTLKRLIAPAMDHVRRYAGRHQKVLINAPYPMHENNSTIVSESRDRLLNEFNDACSKFKDAANANDFRIVSLPSEIYENSGSFKVDHAHYTVSTYQKLFNSVSAELK